MGVGEAPPKGGGASHVTPHFTTWSVDRVADWVSIAWVKAGREREGNAARPGSQFSAKCQSSSVQQLDVRARAVRVKLIVWWCCSV